MLSFVSSPSLIATIQRILQPDPIKQEHSRDPQEPDESVGSKRSLQQSVSVAADLFGMSATGRLVLRHVQVASLYGVHP
ncbi:hypothetical protein [Methylobacterium crusticola]|uniref:hypothetical protein n=1 Tax=Methylobacterium crusticola TaxID=1697972 RepID=UPI000FFB1F81|nr:hypothetical protein [Methylobacterium crusticola]